MNELPFGTVAAETKVLKFLTDYVEPVWIGKRQGLQNRAPPVIPHLRWNHHFDCVSGDAFTNNSSEGKLYFFIFYDCSGFGSTCYMYGSGFCSGTVFFSGSGYRLCSGSGSFYPHANKYHFHTLQRLFMFKNDVNVEKFVLKITLLAFWVHDDKKNADPKVLF